MPAASKSLILSCVMLSCVNASRHSRRYKVQVQMPLVAYELLQTLVHLCCNSQQCASMARAVIQPKVFSSPEGAAALATAAACATLCVPACTGRAVPLTVPGGPTAAACMLLPAGNTAVWCVVVSFNCYQTLHE
jgi:hypothetical protein